MKRRRLRCEGRAVGGCVLALFALLTSHLPAQHANPAAWASEIGPALARAKAEDKMVFVEVAPAWIAASKQLDAAVADPGVQKLLTGFIQVRIVPDTNTLRTISDELGIRDDQAATCILDGNGGVLETGFDDESPAVLSREITSFQKEFGLADAPYTAKWNVSTKEARLYRFEVTADEIAKSPVWAESDKAPPLSPRKAIRLAEAALGRISPSAWRFDAVRLTRLDRQGHWIYRVVFSRAAPLDALGWLDVARADTVPVLMNGHVPEATLIYDGPQGNEPKWDR